MEEKFSEKISKNNYSAFTSQNIYLQSEVNMLEERLKNLDYLKQTYERNDKEKNLEIQALSRELNEYKTETYEKTKKIDELKMIYSKNEQTLLQVIEEHRVNKLLIEEEISLKALKCNQLEKSIQEQYEKSLKIIDENQLLRKEIKDNENAYNNHILQLEEKLKNIEKSQKFTEERVNNIINPTCLKKKQRKTWRTGSANINQLYKNEIEINKTLKSIINEFYKNKPDEVEDRLQNSEKKIKKLEALVKNSSKNEWSSPKTSLKSTMKLSSLSQKS